MKTRPFVRSDAEYAAIETCHNAVWPDALTTTEELSRSDRLRAPHHYWHRIVAEMDDAIVGYAVYCETWWFETRDQYFVDVAVHPEHRRQGVGTALYDVVWEIDWELHQDVPTTDTLQQHPFDEYVKRFESPNFLPDAWFIALEGDRYVGMSTLWATQADLKKLYVGFTGVRRELRRKGIATALKLRTIEFAREYGASMIETDNAEENPMYQLNLKLGFEPAPAYLAYKKVSS